ncbi:MAG: hypothetical protein Q7S21_00875 [archaeon]|nr:hypothetical protein [archaeon]
MSKTKFDPYDVFKPAIKIARYLNAQNIQVVVVLGYSGQLGAYAVKEAWKHLYGKKPMPHFFAIGSFASTRYNDLWVKEFDLMLAQLKKSFSKLFSAETKPKSILLFDSFSWRGVTLNRFKQIFEKEGFLGIRTGVLYDYIPHVEEGYDDFDYRELSSAHKQWDIVGSRTMRVMPAIEGKRKRDIRVGRGFNDFNKLQEIKQNLRKTFNRKPNIARKPR